MIGCDCVDCVDAAQASVSFGWFGQQDVTLRLCEKHYKKFIKDNDYLYDLTF